MRKQVEVLVEAAEEWKSLKKPRKGIPIDR